MSAETLAACPTCSGTTRETVGMVCQTCGTDYGQEPPVRRACAWCWRPAVTTTRLGWWACREHADEAARLEVAVQRSAAKVAEVEAERVAEVEARRQHIEQEFAVVVAALLDGRIDGRQAVASLTAIHLREQS